MKNLCVSFLVDDHPKFYYQAELLLFSLEQNSSFSKSEIVIHCTNRVSQDFLAFLKKKNYTVKIIEPFLDGKYCNKIKQLDFFVENPTDLILLDVDTFICEPIQIPNRDIFSARTAGGSNPPLKIFNHIYKEAGLEVPPLIKTANDTDRETIATNFNGGFYYIPKDQIKLLSDGWSRWASWIFSKKEIFFDRPKDSMHIDQIAMSLTLAEGEFDYDCLSPNYNCPLHNKLRATSIEMSKPIYMLHYHGALDSFGLLNCNKTQNEKIRSTLKKANQQITEAASHIFLGALRSENCATKKDKVKVKSSLLNELKDNLLFNKKLELIIHAGTPKTGSTSLQHFLYQNKDQVSAGGYLYDNVSGNTPAPKHQWLINSIKKDNAEILIKELKILLSKVNSHKGIILSTEGVYNSWFDLSIKSISLLKALDELFELRIITFFRDPIDFTLSLYAQYLKNPQSKRNSVFGKDLSLSEMLQDTWFRAHLDYNIYKEELSQIFGPKKVINLNVKGQNVIELFCSEINLKLESYNSIKRNTRLSDHGLKLVRYINQIPLTNKKKAQCVDLIQQVDQVIGAENKKPLISEADKAIICKLLARSSSFT